MNLIQFLIFILIFSYLSCSSIKISGEKKILQTKDNWKIGIENFKPHPTSTPKKYPIILCHGLMGTGEYFKQNEEDSFVYQLTKEGYNVFVLHLRGRNLEGVNLQGKKDKTTKPGYYFRKIGKIFNDYSFDNYMDQDVDTAISYVLNETKSEKVNWIGHSMGGMVIYARAGTLGESRIANLVTLGSPFTFPFIPKKLSILESIQPLLNISPTVPVGSLAETSSYTPFDFYYFMSLYYYPENMDKEQVRRLTRLGANNESPKVFQQFSNGMGKWEFKSFDGKIKYTSNLKNIQIPTLLVAGRRDMLGSPYIVRYVYEQLGSKDKTMLVIGRTEGHSEDYGHVDLVAGKGIIKDVVPGVLTWLNERNLK